ncbi:hypothetical protein D9619_013079 [Psilocybe cf. subviscida]|uniref:GED domain-containing protein n=1 Tax=Psilocybe cf. subviscida TaxID=2480587 RepID=A0A8H5B045_9AGAR|nr:hypothetical protein D9619_013079 [Psilocybe cf. subviscida]
MGDLRAAIHGEQFNYFVQRNRERYGQFKSEIERTTPDFRPFEDAITWELSGVPFEAIKNLVTEYTKLWCEPSQSCFEAVFGNLFSLVRELVSKHFERYNTLAEYVRAIIFKEINKYQDEARRVLSEILELETTPLYTQNRSALEAEERRWLQVYSHPHGAADGDRSSPITLRYAFPDGRPDITVDALPTWEVADELKVMASVQAYFQVSYKRLVDNVPLTIEHELHQALSDGIEKALLSPVFGGIADGQVDINSLLRENPELEAKRNALHKREQCLRRIKDKLNFLEPQNTPVSEQNRYSTNTD